MWNNLVFETKDGLFSIKEKLLRNARKAKKYNNMSSAKENYDTFLERFIELGSECCESSHYFPRYPNSLDQKSSSVYNMILNEILKKEAIFTERGFGRFVENFETNTQTYVSIAERSGLFEQAIKRELKDGMIYEAAQTARKSGNMKRFRNLLNVSPNYWFKKAEFMREINDEPSNEDSPEDILFFTDFLKKARYSQKLFYKALKVCEENYSTEAKNYIVQIAIKSKLFKKASEACSRNKDFAKAGYIAERGELFKEAAKWFEKAGNFIKAGENAKKADINNPDLYKKAMECYEIKMKKIDKEDNGIEWGGFGPIGPMDSSGRYAKLASDMAERAGLERDKKRLLEKAIKEHPRHIAAGLEPYL